MVISRCRNRGDRYLIRGCSGRNKFLRCRALSVVEKEGELLARTCARSGRDSSSLGGAPATSYLLGRVLCRAEPRILAQTCLCRFQSVGEPLKERRRMGLPGRALLLVLGVGLVASFVPSPRAYPGQNKQPVLACICGSSLPSELCCGSDTLLNKDVISDLLSCPCGSGLPVELCCGGLAPKQALQQKPVVMSTCPCGSGIPYEDCCGEPLFGNGAQKDLLLA